MTLTIKKIKDKKINNPVLLEGLPGMGNVGKITVDFIIQTLEADKIYEIYSDTFPSCVFLNEEGIAELPKIEIYHKKTKNKELLLLTGDIQPSDERGCYEFCETVLDMFQKYKGKEIITLGGIGMKELVKNPKVYCTGTSKDSIKKYKLENVKQPLGLIGPILGVSGLLLGLGKNKGIDGTIFLVETSINPAHLGIKEAKELLTILNKILKLGLNMNTINKEITSLDKEIKKKIDSIEGIKEETKKSKKESINYIG